MDDPSLKNLVKANQNHPKNLIPLIPGRNIKLNFQRKKKKNPEG